MNPLLPYSLAALCAALGLAVLISILLPYQSAWLLAINLVALGLYRYDKMIAGTGRTRVPELVLLLVEAVGGTAGAAVAMWVIRPRHKTRSSGFLFRFALVFMGQLALLFFFSRAFWNF